MTSYSVRETFFRPDDVVARELSAIPASLHNRMQLLLRRSGVSSAFVPIRAMQYLAVVERDEVIFVDAQGGYAYHDGIGGRLIRLAWRPAPERASISAPVYCEIVYYFNDLREVQRRLLSEIGPALDQSLQRQRDPDVGASVGRVLTFRSTGSSE